ncbi:M15 family metallopeptidase [Zobellella iuensis]|uniref:M15 family metallopeptidase n=1 Tax=Zobellella iuensis TaxID=2803811 RepID=A0ABS1QVF4_9GAMM|nr:M15 family metallopeptidase [Zobellella iuensis]MBL1378527.1 M15 family metallopeptidase [Zobellella iuensis]
MTPEALLGLTEDHLVALKEPGHRLQPQAAAAFAALQAAAAGAGFALTPASSFRGFDRQLAIWNGKFEGSRPLLDADSRPLDALALPEPERILAILRWSALPGTSRHHWGTDLDVYDPTLLPPGQRLRLEPWEYQEGGYFYPLSQWLAANMGHFGFYLPFGRDGGGVAMEPWHLSYRPLAGICAAALTPALVAEAIRARPVAGKTHILNLLDEIFARFIRPATEE